MYVTDHSEPVKKYLTFNSQDDRALYEYHQALEAYNADNQEAALAEAKGLSEEEKLLKQLLRGETSYSHEEWAEIFKNELNAFRDGEEYTFTKDLKEAYKKSLAEPLERQILRTIPDHFFWDIKKPNQPKIYMEKNRYNPFRGKEFNNYFELVNWENYNKQQFAHENRNQAVNYDKRL